MSASYITITEQGGNPPLTEDSVNSTVSTDASLPNKQSTHQSASKAFEKLTAEQAEKFVNTYFNANKYGNPKLPKQYADPYNHCLIVQALKAYNDKSSTKRSREIIFPELDLKSLYPDERKKFTRESTQAMYDWGEFQSHKAQEKQNAIKILTELAREEIKNFRNTNPQKKKFTTNKPVLQTPLGQAIFRTQIGFYNNKARRKKLLTVSAEREKTELNKQIENLVDSPFESAQSFVSQAVKLLSKGSDTLYIPIPENNGNSLKYPHDRNTVRKALKTYNEANNTNLEIFFIDNKKEAHDVHGLAQEFFDGALEILGQKMNFDIWLYNLDENNPIKDPRAQEYILDLVKKHNATHGDNVNISFIEKPTFIDFKGYFEDLRELDENDKSDEDDKIYFPEEVDHYDRSLVQLVIKTHNHIYRTHYELRNPLPDGDICPNARQDWKYTLLIRQEIKNLTQARAAAQEGNTPYIARQDWNHPSQAVNIKPAPPLAAEKTAISQMFEAPQQDEPDHTNDVQNVPQADTDLFDVRRPPFKIRETLHSIFREEGSSHKEQRVPEDKDNLGVESFKEYQAKQDAVRPQQR